EADFKTFVLSEALMRRRSQLAGTLAQWTHADGNSAAPRALAYLPKEARIRAKIYPVIRPQTGSFVFDQEDGDPVGTARNGKESKPNALGPCRVSAAVADGRGRNLRRCGERKPAGAGRWLARRNERSRRLGPARPGKSAGGLYGPARRADPAPAACPRRFSV